MSWPARTQQPHSLSIGFCGTASGFSKKCRWPSDCFKDSEYRSRMSQKVPRWFQTDKFINGGKFQLEANQAAVALPEGPSLNRDTRCQYDRRSYVVLKRSEALLCAQVSRRSRAKTFSTPAQLQKILKLSPQHRGR